MYGVDYIISLREPNALFVLGAGLIVVALLLRKKLAGVGETFVPKETPDSKGS